jgi:putative intracellular protease/amidase
MILTSTGQIDSTSPTGVWLEEFSIPYAIFQEAGFDITVVSIKGGDVPIDPRSLAGLEATPEVKAAEQLLKNTKSVSTIDPEVYNAVFFPGGHGTMFDFPNNEALSAVIRNVYYRDGVVAAVCHGPAAFVGVKGTGGDPFVKGRNLTGFTNEEEFAAALDKHMPFLLETELRNTGALFIPGEKFKENVIVDGRLITGQNPASSGKAAREVVKILKTALIEN